MKFPIVLLALILIVLCPFFFIGGPGPSDTPLFRALWDCGHIVFFGLLAALLVQKFSLVGWRSWLALSLIVFVLGGAIEIVQAHTGRNGSWEDLLRDLTGIWLGLFFVQGRQYWLWFGRLFALGFVGVNLYTVAWSAASLFYAYEHFPQLADFESPLAMQGLSANGVRDKLLRNKEGKVIAGEQAQANQLKTHIERSTDYASSGAYGLRIQLSTQRYSGVAFSPMLHNWSGYSYLEFDLYNPAQVPLAVLVRVSDKQHDTGNNAFTDRFNRYSNILPGWNHITIKLEDIARAPKDRRMNMQEITSLVMFANRLREPQLLYLDNLRLR